jgi:hypothetical protein
VGTTGIGFDLKTIWVNVENDDDCMSSDTIKVVFDFAECSGVEDYGREADVYIYPNPTTGKFLIEWTGLSGKVEVEITNLHGNKISDESILVPADGSYKGTFDLAGHPKGVYLLHLIGEEKVLVKKILLQ